MAAAFEVGAAEEGRHAPGAADRAWSERWTFELATAEGDLAAWVAVQLHPVAGLATYHCVLVGAGRPVVAVADRSVPLPLPTAGLDLRTHGLWAAHTCETPLEHWSVGNEAYAVGLDDPADLLLADPWGDRVPLGLDLEWEAAAPARRVGVGPGGGGYAQPCRVHGEVLVGAEEIDLDATGWRSHEWGHLSSPRTSTLTGWLGGDPVHLTEPEVGAAALAVAVVHRAPLVGVGVDGDPTPRHRALCHLAAAGGATGLAWLEGPAAAPR